MCIGIDKPVFEVLRRFGTLELLNKLISDARHQAYATNSNVSRVSVRSWDGPGIAQCNALRCGGREIADARFDLNNLGCMLLWEA